jgi:hypothetical protein
MGGAAGGGEPQSGVTGVFTDNCANKDPGSIGRPE